MALKDSLWRIHLIYQKTESWCAYITQQNYCVKLVRADELKYQHDLTIKFSSNHKLLYRHTNKLRKVQRRIPALRAPHRLVQTAKDAANALRQQFSHNFQNSPVFPITPIHPTISLALHRILFTATEVVRRLMSLRQYSSPGADGILPKALQAVVPSVAELLAHFFQRYLDTMLVPTT